MQSKYNDLLNLFVRNYNIYILLFSMTQRNQVIIVSKLNGLENLCQDHRFRL